MTIKIPDSGGGVGPRAGDAYRRSLEVPAEEPSDTIDPLTVIPGAFAMTVLEPKTYCDSEFLVIAIPAIVIRSADVINCASEWSFVSWPLPSLC